MIPQAANSWTIGEAAHLLNRAGFGGYPDAIKALHALGRKGAVDSLLSAQKAPEDFSMPEWAKKDQALDDLKSQRDSKKQMMIATRGLSSEKAEEIKRELFKKSQMLKRERGI